MALGDSSHEGIRVSRCSKVGLRLLVRHFGVAPMLGMIRSLRGSNTKVANEAQQTPHLATPNAASSNPQLRIQQLLFPFWFAFFPQKTHPKITFLEPQNAHFWPFSRVFKITKRHNALIISSLTIPSKLACLRTNGHECTKKPSIGGHLLR